MPQLSKLRIVNLYYNDGNRLIPDELYDFSTDDGKAAHNALINLENGGGKSVLVQFSMQPIIPKAKVAGRKIDDFFKKQGDHCYVVLEWLKDNSNEKLLTGISICSGVRQASEDNSEQTSSIRYYTFCTHYTDDNSDFSIANLPLSENKNSRFVPAEYDRVKNIARKSNGKLEYYSSDDNPKWRGFLEQYGIFQDEWHMIEQLNAEEGGLGKYFGDFKTSDKLIDNLIIPIIEKQLSNYSGRTSKDDTSLESMLESFIEQYSNQKDKLEELELFKNFAHAIKQLEPLAENLWVTEDNMRQSLRKLFGFSDSLNIERTRLNHVSDDIISRTEQAKDDLRRISHEEYSAEFYTASIAYDEAESVLLATQSHESELLEKQKAADLKFKAYECARIYEMLKKTASQITALNNQINTLECGGDNAEQLARLKYSVMLAATQAYTENTALLQQLNSDITQLQDSISDYSDKRKQAISELDKIKDDSKRNEGKLELLKSQTDNLVQALNLGISRNIFGQYGIDEVNNELSKNEKEKTDLESVVTELNNQLTKIKREQKNLGDSEFEIRVKINGLKKDEAAISESISTYKTCYESIVKVCSEHSIDENSVFSGELTDYLSSQIQEKQVELNSTLHKADLKKKEITAAKNGSVHIPFEVTEYLDSCSVKFKTCEHYLLGLVRSNSITAEKCSEILTQYPVVAYGIIVENSERYRLKGSDEDWLPASVPLFTIEDMGRIIEGYAEPFDVIALYSHSYFSNPDEYLTNLKNARALLIESADRLRQRIARLNEQLDEAKKFTYSSSWQKEKESELYSINNEISESNKKLSEISDRKIQLENEENTVSSEIEKNNFALQENENTHRFFISLMDSISNENEFCELDEQLKIQIKNQQNIIDEMSADLSELSSKHAELSEKRKSAENVSVEISKILDTVGVCEKTEILEGDWRDLFSQYNEISTNISAEVSQLQQNLKEKSEAKAEYEKSLRKKNISQEMYAELVYDEAIADSAKKLSEKLTTELDNIRKQKENDIRESATAHAKLEQAKTKLSEFGEPLERDKIGSDFEARKQSVNNLIIQLKQEKADTDKKITSVERVIDRIDDKIGKPQRRDSSIAVALESDINAQFEQLAEKYTSAQVKLTESKNETEKTLKTIKDNFNGNGTLVSALNGLLDMLDNTEGETFFTLAEQVKYTYENAIRYVAKLKNDLDEFESTRSDLIHHCALQGQQIYDGLKRMGAGSRVDVYSSKSKKQMIKFAIPEEVDFVSAEQFIAKEIEREIKEFISAMSETELTEAAKRRRISQIVGSSQLLRKYINRQSITVRAYKIDRNSDNAGYRTWEETQVQNSGAEKFIVYFAVILSLMHYTRGSLGEFQDKTAYSALILDNPFGATSSQHILNPMFEIAKHFRVQLICFSHIENNDVLQCFHLVIRAFVKKRLMSSSEILTHEGNEHIEHGFYRAEQLMF